MWWSQEKWQLPQHYGNEYYKLDDNKGCFVFCKPGTGKKQICIKDYNNKN
jgi:hypothetical protein